MLIGTPFALTGKARTDGSRVRKAVAQVLSEHSLPLAARPTEYSIVPPKKKGVPRILREYVDTYIVTSGDSYNLQVWNRNPATSAVQIEYESGEPLLARDVRFVLVRVPPDRQEIRSVLVLSPDYIESHFGKFGKPTIKHQMTIAPRARQMVLDAVPPIAFFADTPSVSSAIARSFSPPSDSIHDAPVTGRLASLRWLRDTVGPRLVGAVLDDAPTKSRGQGLEFMVARLLGYALEPGTPLAGGYPDIRNQVLEVKVQDAPTVDMGRFTPQFVEDVPSCPGFTTVDVRYLIALTDPDSGIIEGIVLCPGIRLGELFTYVSDVSWKCQRSIPMSFFDRHDGRASFNP